MSAKPILCLDFDGVIHSYTSGWQGPRTIPDPPVDGAIDQIARYLNAGFDVVVHSSRACYFCGIWAMRRWLRHWAADMWYDVPGYHGVESVRFSRQKPPAHVTIDDRAITFTGTWPTPNELRSFAPWNRRDTGKLGKS